MNQKRLENTILWKKESRVNQNYLYLYVAQNHSSVYWVNCMHSSEVTNQYIKANKDKTHFAGAGGEGCRAPIFVSVKDLNIFSLS